LLLLHGALVKKIIYFFKELGATDKATRNQSIIGLNPSPQTPSSIKPSNSSRDPRYGKHGRRGIYESLKWNALPQMRSEAEQPRPFKKPFTPNPGKIKTRGEINMRTTS
jgi:hypothetical protein